MRVTATALVWLVLTAGSAAAQQPLEVSRTADELRVRGDHFTATWRADRGWQIASVEVEDYAGQWRIDGERDDISGIGAIAVRCGGTTYLTYLGEASTPEVVEETGDKLTFDVRVRPRSATGAGCPLEISQRFTVFGEGAGRYLL